jgi:hypothetical protein
MWYVYTIEYFSAIKKNEIISFVGKQIELEIIRQTQTNETHFLSYTKSRAINTNKQKDMNLHKGLCGRGSRRRNKGNKGRLWLGGGE